MGRAVQNPELDGVAIYFVEPKYLDKNKGKAKRKCSSNNKGKQLMNKQKRLGTGRVAQEDEGGDIADNDSKMSDVDDDTEDITNDVEIHGVDSQLPNITKESTAVVGPHTNCLIPDAPTNTKYEVNAMETYINAHS
ncbi:hypothetical protein SERLA73DRAFT_80007 [Serpula lacrymans var. lacrymans S7.3]|uniref:Uncharacterized protein n=2 Tax=Serpula lacrymans var. lacrymans TaxID=341189 RepID=F8QIC3_SERL3|nr:uncharacterized protein SERLADRAFT_441180 [Serpula lacrymans var. lacrymans S7.9]EGN91944.1 hypothetical protein SERLA73DRAFT_80007 [Serpula lacrymans var. lacrymans S7.3]EGO21967.1 hypothetical protein SERLADRAFT_441180 [Serpula lacrymans var. lacrymans S7.9]